MITYSPFMAVYINNKVKEVVDLIKTDQEPCDFSRGRFSEIDGEHYDVAKAAEMQREYCGKNGVMFAPIDGVCWNCHKNIYRPIKHENKYTEKNVVTYTGISVEGASRYLITGCPHCSRSFCD